MNLEVNPEEFVSSTESLRKGKLKNIEDIAVEWVNTIMKKIQADKEQFILQNKQQGYYHLSYDRYNSDFPADSKITNEIARILHANYKLNLESVYDRKYDILHISTIDE